MRRSTLALAGALAMGSSLALAADLLPPPPPLAFPEPLPPAAEFGGWYLRGDVGVGSVSSDRWTQRPSDNGSTIVASGFNRYQLDNTAFAGAGAGYQFNSYLRADVTGEFRAGGSAYGNYQEQTQYYVGNQKFDFLGQNNYRGSYDSIVGLVNVYADLGTFYGLTPFIGGGVGFAHHDFHGFTDSGYAFVNYGQPGAPVYPVAANLVGNQGRTSLAYALMAGVAYDINPRLKLELGYRYLNMGEARSGKVFCSTSCDARVAEGFRVKEIVSHDFRLGLRWLLGGAVAAPAPIYVPEAPLVRKG